ncbi:flagellar basal body rod protein FlgC [Shouchella shacheensis]|uniref:flagellar basal body rod protein FlgC n=1 Tax=Shouchella shacheensis TaxID=1649580 RepID=UPI00073FB842|nr:flagellar basal body rod protein FlgC [Shouchella shacheensis]
MTLFNSVGVSGSALTTQRLRMDVAASNIANADTTRARQVEGEWEPYRRQMVVQRTEGTVPFQSHLQKASGALSEGTTVAAIVEDSKPFTQVFDPTHPDAQEEGYVLKPNVDMAREMVDVTSATRSYEANVSALQATKGMMMKALEIGK